MLTEKDYCDYDTCVALKELGYYYDSHYNWRSKDDFVSATTYYRVKMIPMIHLYDAHKWLREGKGLHIEIDRVGYDWLVSVIETKNNLCLDVKNRCQSYEEALLKGIKAAVKILKEE